MGNIGVLKSALSNMDEVKHLQECHSVAATNDAVPLIHTRVRPAPPYRIPPRLLQALHSHHYTPTRKNHNQHKIALFRLLLITRKNRRLSGLEIYAVSAIKKPWVQDWPVFNLQLSARETNQGGVRIFWMAFSWTKDCVFKASLD